MHGAALNVVWVRKIFGRVRIRKLKYLLSHNHFSFLLSFLRKWDGCNWWAKKLLPWTGEAPLFTQAHSPMTVLEMRDKCISLIFSFLQVCDNGSFIISVFAWIIFVFEVYFIHGLGLFDVIVSILAASSNTNLKTIGLPKQSLISHILREGTYEGL
jgi:hypothetical protein